MRASGGLTEVGFEDLTHQLFNHYRQVLATTEGKGPELAVRISPDYLDQMKAGLRHWIDGDRERRLAWGVFHFRK